MKTPTIPWALVAATAWALAACGGGNEAAMAPSPAQKLRALAVSTGGTATPEDAARQLMDFGQLQFPALFPGAPSTEHLDAFAYRHYASTGTTLGVVVQPGTAYPLAGVYVMGGSFGNAPTYVGQLGDFITPQPPAFELNLTSDKAVVLQGGSTTVKLNLTRLRGVDGTVQLTVQGLPAGVTASATSVALNAQAGTATAELTLSAQGTAPHSLPTTAQVLATLGTLRAVEPITVTVRGAPGAVDTSFGGGIVTTSLGASEDYPYAVAVQADGKVITAGTTATNTGTVVGLTRHLRDGALDAGFGTGGQVLTRVGTRGDSANAVAVQSDGKIVVAGWTDNTGSDSNFLVLRYLSDGRLDPAFGQGGQLVVPFGTGIDRAYALAIQDDGKIVAAGTSTSDGSSGLPTDGQDFALIRVLANGTLDTSFGQGGRVVTPLQAHGGGDVVYALALPRVNGEQRILAVGGEGDFLAARYLGNGALDSSFGAAGKVVGLFNRNIGSARGVTILPGGKMVLAGGIYNDFAAAQLNENGTLDPAFGNGGTAVVAVSTGNWDSATAVARQADGKLVLGGWVYSGNSSSADFAALRLNANGSLDNGFGNQGIAIHPAASGTRSDAARGLVLQADKRVPTVRAILAGEANASNNDFVLMRLWL